MKMATLKEMQERTNQLLKKISPNVEAFNKRKAELENLNRRKENLKRFRKPEKEVFRLPNGTLKTIREINRCEVWETR
jgi:hypothetical protein